MKKWSVQDGHSLPIKAKPNDATQPVMRSLMDAAAMKALPLASSSILAKNVAAYFCPWQLLNKKNIHRIGTTKA
jgi:hypothetical protein